jgi:hypothetical protein
MISRLRSRPISRAIRRTGGVCAAATVVLLLIATGCDEEPMDPGPGRVGVIHGRIHDGRTVDFTGFAVRARSPYGAAPRVEIQTVPDDDGHFALVVPAGPVIVSVTGPNVNTMYWDDAGVTLDWDEAQIIDVGGGTRQIDIACGRVSAHVELPPGQARAFWGVRLVRRDRINSSSVSRHSWIEDAIDVDWPMIPPGEYFLKVESPQDCEVFLPACFDTAAAELLTVRAEEETRHESAISSLATLSGTVTGSWQVLGFSPPTVAAYYGTDSVVSAMAAADGSFSLSLLAGGEFHLSVAIGGLGRWVGGADLETATTFAVAAGQELSGIVYTESGLRCAIDPAGEVPVTGYQASLMSASGPIWIRSYQGSSFGVANLPPGDLTLRIAPTSVREIWLPQYWDRQSAAQDADPITIPGGGGVADVSVHLLRGGRILGRILDVDGQPPSPEEIYAMIYTLADSVHEYQLYTNRRFQYDIYDEATGDYFLTQLDGGPYKLRLHLSGQPWLWWPTRASWDSATVITIEDATDRTGIDWRLPY